MILMWACIKMILMWASVNILLWASVNLLIGNLKLHHELLCFDPILLLKNILIKIFLVLNLKNNYINLRGAKGKFFIKI